MRGGEVGRGAIAPAVRPLVVSPGRRPPRPSGRTSASPTNRRTRPPTPLRLFVALDLPEAAKREIDVWGQGALADPALRPVPAANLRIVLVYLGYRPEQQVGWILTAVRDLCDGMASPLVEMRDPESRPARGRSRLYALPATSPSAEILHASLCEQLSLLRLHEPEERPFWPHVTVARVRPEKRGTRRPMSVERAPTGPLPPSITQPFWARSIGLYRSDLHPEGVRHSLLAKVDFLGPE